MSSAELAANDLSVDLDGRRILSDVSLSALAGSMVAVSGPSGSGKTTLLSALGGLLAPAAGSIAWRGSPVLSQAGSPLAGTAFVLQTYGLVAVLSASENVEIALRARGIRGRDATSAASAALARVDVADLADRLVEELSGGQSQRVAVARALVVGPALLLADEPTSELDEETRDVVLSELRAEAERGAVVVVATHDAEVVAQCDAEYHLVDGVVQDDFRQPGPSSAGRTGFERPR